MSKKAPSNKSTANFGRIAVDQAITSKLERAAKTAQALKLNKEFRTARTQKKRWREHVVQNGIRKHEFPKTPQSSGILKITQLLSDKIPEWQSEVPSGTIRAGFQQCSTDWHKEARTGVTGKRAAKPPANDRRYSAYPYVPYTK